MRPLSDDDILFLWEQGARRHPVDRALLILALHLPDTDHDLLAQMSIGQRNAWLLALRQALRGSAYEMRAACPECGETLEFQLELPVSAPDMPQPAPDALLQEGQWRVHYRSPNSYDLAAISAAENTRSARTQLIEHCILAAERAGALVDPATLPEPILQAIADDLLEREPLLEIRIAVTCALCGHGWSSIFDPLKFLWTDIDSSARHLLDEVQQLAAHYGWTERDVLSMSRARRRHYLERARA